MPVTFFSQLRKDTGYTIVYSATCALLCVTHISVSVSLHPQEHRVQILVKNSLYGQQLCSASHKASFMVGNVWSIEHVLV